MQILRFSVSFEVNRIGSTGIGLWDQNIESDRMQCQSNRIDVFSFVSVSPMGGNRAVFCEMSIEFAGLESRLKNI